MAAATREIAEAFQLADGAQTNMEICRYIKASVRLTIDLRREPTWTEIVYKVEGMNSDARAGRRQFFHDQRFPKGGAHAAPPVGGRHHA